MRPDSKKFNNCCLNNNFFFFVAWIIINLLIFFLTNYIGASLTTLIQSLKKKLITFLSEILIQKKIFFGVKLAFKAKQKEREHKKIYKRSYNLLYGITKPMDSLCARA